MLGTRPEIAAPLVTVSHLSKKYCRNLRLSLSYGLYDIAREFFRRAAEDHVAALLREEFWALDDVSFELDRGESPAVRGAHGGGKSTLLKALHGLIKPDWGTILSSGAGELGCVIPRNTLVAGSYWLKAAILDARSLQPLALFGWLDAPQSFFVHAHPSELSNVLR